MNVRNKINLKIKKKNTTKFVECNSINLNNFQIFPQYLQKK